jgi:hypothetical protein
MTIGESPFVFFVIAGHYDRRKKARQLSDCATKFPGSKMNTIGKARRFPARRVLLQNLPGVMRTVAKTVAR